MKPEPKSMLSGWMKGAFRGGKKEMQESIHQKLDFILSTAPMWDRFVLSSHFALINQFYVSECLTILLLDCDDVHMEIRDLNLNLG